MVTKGIITSIDFNGNTCQVRIPFFETAGNDPIISTAVVSNTPGSYNGYKVDDVVLVAFEDGKMETPVVIGKLYLGAEKEKADPRGSLNTESLVAAKTAVVPADTKLTTNTDKNLPNTMNPYANLSSIANNLNKLNTDVNYLDVFTNNQFSSVITDVNKQGEELRSEIKQTAENIGANVVHKHQNGTQDALGWDLTTDSWKINAKDTVNGAVKDINIVTIDRNGMSIAGDLKLNGYPKNIVVRYAQNDSDTTHPALDSTEWSTNVPTRADGQYIWQWTHTESFLFDKNTNSWNEQDDDKVVCITGAKGEKGDQGDAGYNTATVMLYKRSTGVPRVDWGDAKETIYTFSSKTLSVVPTDWKYTIAAAGNADAGELYCIAAIASSNTNTDTIAVTEFGNPILYVKNGESTVTLSIENDFDSIPCDFEGNPSYSELDWKTKTKHTIKVLEGQNPQVFNVINFSSDNQIPSTGYAVVYKPDSSITYVVDTTDKTLFTAHITGLTTDSANVLYTLYKNGTKIDEARFAATKLKAGAPGDSAVDYDILFSSGTIKVSKTGDKTPKTINVNFKKTVGQGEPEDFSGKYKVFIDNEEKYSNFESNDVSSITLATHDATGEELDISSAKSNVTVELFANYPNNNIDNWIKVEGETIDVVADGTDGTSVAQLILYKRSTEIPSSPASDGKWTYNAANGSLTCENQETKWKTGIPSGMEPCYESHAAVLVTGLDTIIIKDAKWSAPAKFVENGADGQPGVYIKEVKQWYILWLASAPTAPTKPTNNTVPTEPENPSTREKWMSTPPEAVNGYVVWTCYGSIFSDDIPNNSKKRHIEYSVPVKDAAYALAQGKTTNYYSPTEPSNKIKIGDCWLDTGYVKITHTPDKKTGYLGKFIISADGNISVNQDKHDADRYIQVESSSTKLIKITPENIDTLIGNGTIVVGTSNAFETGNLKQCSGFKNDGTAIWEDIAGELVTNKLTANYINALDITSKKIQVLDSNNDTLFLADGINGNGEVNIGGFTVDSNRLYAGTPGTSNSIELASFHNLIAYKSNNQKVASSYAVSKITVNKATDLTVYIRSYAETYYDYIMISNPNVPSYPTTYLSNYVKAYTMGNQNSSSALASYKKVEYYGLKQNDCIYVVYKKDGNTDSGTGTGYLLIPETTDISIEAVDDTDYTFERDTSLDIKEAGASLKVGSNFSVDRTGAIRSTSGTIGGFTIDSNRLYAGTPGEDNGIELASIGTNKASISVGSNFSVDSTGAIKSTRGTIGKLAIDENGLSYENIFKIDPTVSTWDSVNQRATLVARSALVQGTLILPVKSQSYQGEISLCWPVFNRNGLEVFYKSNRAGSDKEYKLSEHTPWDLAGIPMVSTNNSAYSHSMTRDESLACFGEDYSAIYGWGAPIIYTDRRTDIGGDWVLVDLYSLALIRKILAVVCTTCVQPTTNNKGENTTPRPNQTGNLFVSYDDYTNGKFWIRSNTNDKVTVSILAIGVTDIEK